MTLAWTRSGKTVIRYPEVPARPPRPVHSEPPPVLAVAPVSLASPISRNSSALPPPVHRQHPEEVGAPRDNAIPPLYNEAWNVGPTRSATAE